MPPANKNQNPEHIARDQIDAKLAEADWHVQAKDKINFNAGLGIAVREYLTDVGEADYVRFVARHAVGVIEAKPEDWGHKITTVEEQSEGCASAKLKWIANKKINLFSSGRESLAPDWPMSTYSVTALRSRSCNSQLWSLVLTRVYRAIRMLTFYGWRERKG